MKTYILEGKTPVECNDHCEWGKWYADNMAKRHVGNDYFTINGENVRVSTVFLALDHGWGEGPPILYETMIFGGIHSDYQERYRTWEEAEVGHKEAIKRAHSPEKLEDE